MRRFRNYKSVNKFDPRLLFIFVFFSLLSIPAIAFETFGILTEEESKEEYLLDNRLPRDAPHQIWRHWMCFENKGVRYRCRKIPNGKRKQNLITGFELTSKEKPLRFELSVVHTKDDCIGYLAEIKSYIRPFKNFCAFAMLFSSDKKMDFYELSKVKSQKGNWIFPEIEP
ncbi:MAG: hypothetical protein RL189_361 [Pseudomonadota bacterium]|jgi:hypothetical protein